MAGYSSHVLDIYSAWLHVATTRKQWRKLRAREVPSLAKNPDGIGFTSLDLHETDEGATIAHLSVFVDVAAHAESQVALVETVAHEAAHVAGLLLSHYGHDIRAADEPHAYLVGWTTQWLWRNVNPAS